MPSLPRSAQPSQTRRELITSTTSRSRTPIQFALMRTTSVNDTYCRLSPEFDPLFHLGGIRPHREKMFSVNILNVIGWCNARWKSGSNPAETQHATSARDIPEKSQALCDRGPLNSQVGFRLLGCELRPRRRAPRSVGCTTGCWANGPDRSQIPASSQAR